MSLRTLFESRHATSTPAPLTIRPLTPDRAQRAYAIDLVAYGIDHWHFSAWRSLVVAPSTHVWVALRGERVIGFLAFQYHGAAVHVVKLAVDIDHRRQGIGAELVSSLLREKVLTGSNAVMSAVMSFPVPRPGDRRATDACRFISRQGFTWSERGDAWVLTFGPDEPLGCWNSPEICP